MRRPVVYLAGLLLATGASFAMTAGPAAAAVSHDGHVAQSAHSPYDDGDNEADIDVDFTGFAGDNGNVIGGDTFIDVYQSQGSDSYYGCHDYADPGCYL